MEVHMDMEVMDHEPLIIPCPFSFMCDHVNVIIICVVKSYPMRMHGITSGTRRLCRRCTITVVNIFVLYCNEGLNKCVVGTFC